MFPRMRTTINIDDRILAEARAQAARSSRTLSQVIEDALRESFDRVRRSSSEGPIELPTFSGRLRPGVDLDDSSAMIELMGG